MWTVPTGETVEDALMGHTSSIWSITASADGCEFASSSEDGKTCIMDTQAHTNLTLYRKSEAANSELSEEELRIR